MRTTMNLVSPNYKKCERCGDEFHAPLNIVKYCEECSIVIEEESERQEAELKAQKLARAKQYAQENYLECAAMAGLPPRLYAASFDTMTSDEHNALAITMCRRLGDDGGILYLSGEAGTGKTWIAAALCRERILALKPVQFIRSIDLLNSIRNRFRGNSNETDIDPFKTKPFLVIDDLGTECFTDWSVGYWYDLIDYRYNYLLPTVITSNLNLKELMTKVSARVVSRIAESSMVVKVTGPDRRNKKPE